MKALTCLVLFTSIVTHVCAHDGHDHDTQMPLDYVRFPFQAVYPGDDEGNQAMLLPRVHLFSRQGRIPVS